MDLSGERKYPQKIYENPSVKIWTLHGRTIPKNHHVGELHARKIPPESGKTQNPPILAT
jgi:hypothetical protein